MESYCEADFYFEGTVRFCVAVLFTMNLGSDEWLLFFFKYSMTQTLKWVLQEFVISLLGNTYSSS